MRGRSLFKLHFARSHPAAGVLWPLCADRGDGIVPEKCGRESWMLVLVSPAKWLQKPEKPMKSQVFICK